MADLNYSRTLDWLYALEAQKGMDFRLERLTPVLERLGHPETSFASIHVAGTNGKGSTSAMLHAVYHRAGYRVGLYTSPHLLSFRERIRVGDDLIAETRVVENVDAIRDAAAACDRALTFFEFVTIAAFLEFRTERVDLAIVETGLGGRLDATNVVRSIACVITGVDLDHVQFLGNTIESVAAEKAGIVRDAVPVITGPLPPSARDVVTERCRKAGALWLPATEVDCAGLRVGLAGAHQRSNAAVVCRTVGAVSDLFPVPRPALERGIAEVRWAGRFETLSAAVPAVIVDGGHNPQAMRAVRTLLEDEPVARPLALVFGAMVDKDWTEMLRILAPVADRVYLVPVDSPRSYAPGEAGAGLDATKFEIRASAPAGLAAARRWCGDSGTILVTGSIFLVAELYASCAGADGGCADVGAE